MINLDDMLIDILEQACTRMGKLLKKKDLSNDEEDITDNLTEWVFLNEWEEIDEFLKEEYELDDNQLKYVKIQLINKCICFLYINVRYKQERNYELDEEDERIALSIYNEEPLTESDQYQIIELALSNMLGLMEKDLNYKKRLLKILTPEENRFMQRIFSGYMQEYFEMAQMFTSEEDEIISLLREIYDVHIDEVDGLEEEEEEVCVDFDFERVKEDIINLIGIELGEDRVDIAIQYIIATLYYELTLKADIDPEDTEALEFIEFLTNPKATKESITELFYNSDEFSEMVLALFTQFVMVEPEIRIDIPEKLTDKQIRYVNQYRNINPY